VAYLRLVAVISTFNHSIFEPLNNRLYSFKVIFYRLSIKNSRFGGQFKLSGMSTFLSRLFTSPPVMVFIAAFTFIAMLFGDPFGLAESRAEREWKERTKLVDGYLSSAFRPADTVPYKEGAAHWDSIQHIYAYEDKINYAREYHYRGLHFASAYALYFSTGCTQCDVYEGFGNYKFADSDMHDTYYLAIKGFELKEWRYYLRDRNTDFVFEPFADPAPENRADSNLRRLRFYNSLNEMHIGNFRSVPFRYDYWKKTVLIPVNKKTYNVLSVINVILGIGFGIYFLYILINIPYRIIRNIAVGKAFHEKTIRLVDFLAYNFLLFPFMIFFIRCIGYLVLSKYITSDLRFIAWRELLGSGAILYIGLILFALGVALKKGYKLQAEQDLTI
jgi:hypothetical protein